MITWLIWNLCNSERVGKPYTKVSLIREKAKNMVLNFQSAQLPWSWPGPAVPRDIKWKPPSSLYYKINFDGATFNELRAAGLGVVIRDSLGCVIGALSERILVLVFATTLEALAFRRAHLC